MAQAFCIIPEKARHLLTLKKAGFNVPPFLYMPAEDFLNKDFDRLKTFLHEQCDGFKVIIRSCHHGRGILQGRDL